MTRFREHVWYHLRDLPLMVWRDSSVQHFDTVSGDYVWPPRSNSCVPFRQVRRQYHLLAAHNAPQDRSLASLHCSCYVSLGVVMHAPVELGCPAHTQGRRLREHLDVTG